MGTKDLNGYINGLLQPYSREKSWTHCYKAFYAAHEQVTKSEELIDVLSLHLCVYLASWGMYRGSSFLLRSMDYKVHSDVVKLLLDTKYEKLWNLRDAFDTDLLWELSKKIRCHYEICRDLIEDNGTATDTLVTKILLGTMACIPAYDTQVCNNLRKRGYSAKYSRRSLSEMMAFYVKNQPEIDIWHTALQNAEGIESYPLMKAIDTYLWHNT